MRPYTALVLLCLVPLAAHAAGEIYRWKDSNGAWHYSDQPQPGAELVKSSRKPGPTPASTNPVRNTSTATSTSSVPPPVIPITDEVAQQVRDEAASAKSDQCKKATVDYDKSIQAQRMYKLDEKGERVFLSNAELDQARLTARSARDLACAPQ